MRYLLSTILALCVLAFTGCMTAPPPAQASYASDLGDRSTTALDEVVVSLPLRGSSEPYQNLHIHLVVIGNPVRPTPAGSYEVESLARRLDARIGAQLSSALSRLGSQSLDMQPLREKVAAEANNVLSGAVASWKYAGDYRLEVAIQSMYWTDASVGKAPRSGRGWF